MQPGRPSHVYQGMVLAAAKLVLNVDVQAGNLTASEYAQPTLWGWLASCDWRRAETKPGGVRPGKAGREWRATCSCRAGASRGG